MQLTGFTVMKNGEAVASEDAGEPGEYEIREALVAIAAGHHLKALDLLFDGAALFAASKDVSLPWD